MSVNDYVIYMKILLELGLLPGSGVDTRFARSVKTFYVLFDQNTDLCPF